MTEPRTGLTRHWHLLRHGTGGAHQVLRFVIAGGTVTVVHLGLGLTFSGPLGMPIQVAIPIAYVLAVFVHFSLQRWFVFHGSDFALPIHVQAWRYVPIGVCQYSFTAAATAVLPGVLGVNSQVAYVIATLTASAVTFVVLRLGVFHERSAPAG